MSKFTINPIVFAALSFAMSLGLLYYNRILGIVSMLLICLLGYLYLSTRNRTEKEVYSGIERIYRRFDNLNRRQMNQLPVAFLITDKNGNIVWYNEAFHQTFYMGSNREIQGKNINDELNLRLEDCLAESDMEYSYKNVDFQLVTQAISDSRGELYIINFFDVTLYKRQKQIYSRYEPIFCYIMIDNYDDIVDSLSTYEKSSILSQIDLRLTDWANRKDAFIMHYENDRYLVIFEREKLAVMERAHFHILDEVREIQNSENLTITLSIGIGVSDKPIAIRESDSMSHSALELALARGGDQAVVKKGDDNEYYGGKNEAQEKRTKVKARIKAQGLKDLITEADNVLIMGHKTPDMDCLGAGIGLIDACRELNKNGKYVLSEINYSIKSLCEYLSEEQDYDNVFITPAETKNYIRDNTLLIVVDTQNRDYVEFPELTELISKTVVIDHHRRSGASINKPTIDYCEVYASSTCELVTELLQYFDAKSIITPVGANALMSGMYMDTKMFTQKTGVRTFEAASYLKRRGADMIRAKAMLQDDFSTYSSRTIAVQNADIYFDSVAVSLYEDHTEYAKIIAAQAADELLNIKGISASFLILKSTDGISISGRSNGEVNVQIILEQLGGGGHLAMAGAQIKDTDDLLEAKSTLLEVIGLYFKERTAS